MLYRAATTGSGALDQKMNAVEFEGTVTPNGQIAIPAEIVEQLPPGESLHVVLQWDLAADEDGVWRAQGRQRFEAAYAPEDAVYDQLMDETPTR
jgi:hypothetical protein